MKLINMKNWVSALVGMTFMVTFPACTDDHFEVADGGDGLDGNATLTLWQQIEAQPDLSKFASIVASTPVFKDELHPIKGYTFKDLLNSNQIFTVFAPSNDAFTDANMLYYENLLKTRPYDVFLSLVGNHIARNNYAASGTGIEKIMLVNNKRATFDKSLHKLKDLELFRKNIPATNGTLHVLSAQLPFAYNIYEYLRAHEAEYPELNKWLAAHDTIYFNEAASFKSGSDPVTGEPIYVDSVYTRTNSIYHYIYEKTGAEWEMAHKGFGANIEQEDSIWAMILPSDAAWVSMRENMKKWYNYAPNYPDMVKIDALNADNKTNNAAKKNMVRTIPDTLWKDAIAMDLASVLTFNVRRQPRKPGHLGVWNAEEFKTASMAKMFNNRSDTFTINERVKTKFDSSDDVKALLFGNNKPIEVSNGLIYPVENWNFFETYGAQDVEVKVSTGTIFQRGRYNLTTAQKKEKNAIGEDMYSQNNGEGTFEFKQFINRESKLAPTRGEVSRNDFCFVSSGDITLKLIDQERNHQIMSGVEYEIAVVLVPSFYRYHTDYIYDPEFGRYDPEATVPLDPDDPESPEVPADKSIIENFYRKDSLQIDFSYITADGKESNNKTADRCWVGYKGEKVDTVWAKKKDGITPATITFPASYMNLKYTYPTIKLRPLNNSKKEYVTYYSIDRIILRAKKD